MDLDARLLGALLAALEAPERSRPPEAGARILSRAAQEGFLADWLLEDYLHATEPRLVNPFSGANISTLAIAAGLHSRRVTPRPRPSPQSWNTPRPHIRSRPCSDAANPSRVRA